MPGSGLPCAPDTLPEKLTRRGTPADCPDGDACCALVTEQKNNNENTAVQASRYFPPFMTVSPFLRVALDRKSTRLNSSHRNISYAVFCLKTPHDAPEGQPQQSCGHGLSADCLTHTLD